MTCLSLTTSGIWHLPRVPPLSLQLFGPDQNARYCQGGCGMPRPSNGAGGLSGSLRGVRATPTWNTSNNQRTAATPVRQKANSVLDARNPTQVPNTIGDLLLIDHLLLRFKPKYSPPGLTPGSALALLLVPPKCSQRYPLDFALGLIWPSTSRSGVGLPFALQPVCTRAGLVIKRLPFRGVWAARRHSLPGVIKILRDLVDIAR